MSLLSPLIFWTIPASSSVCTHSDLRLLGVSNARKYDARSIPEVGQSFTFHGFRFRVLRRARNRITALRIQPLLRTQPAKAG